MRFEIEWRNLARLAFQSALLGSILNCAALLAGELGDRVQEATPFRLLDFVGPTNEGQTPKANEKGGAKLPSETIELVSSNLAMNSVPLPLSGSLGLTVIDGRDIACRTAQHWTPAQVLRARGRTIIQAYCDEDECSQKAANSLAVFLNMQANHQEDIGAASALRAYYTRIAIREHLQVTFDSLSLIALEKGKQQAAQKGGLAAGTDLSDFERQKFSVEDQQIQLGSQERQLRTLLSQLARVDYAMDEVQQESLEVLANPMDCERLKAIALSTRHDIRGWSYLSGQVNETSAPIYAKMLSTMVGGFGLPLPTISGLKNLLCPPDHSCLTANMQYELNLTVETHRRWICQAVDEKCAKVQLAYRRIELAQQTLSSWENRIEQLEELEAMGDAEPEQIAVARVGRLKARADEISRRLDARIAEIDLAEALGGLSCRCCSGQPWLITGLE